MNPAPYMCGSSMGMVFCPANYASNGGTGFSFIFPSWVISSSQTYTLACFGVALLGAFRQAVIALRREVLSANRGRGINGGGENASLIGADSAQEGGGGPEGLPVSKRGHSVSFFASPKLRARPGVLLAIDTTLFAIGLAAAYIAMLVAMAYDVGLLTCLVLGEASGYAICRVMVGAANAQEVEEASCCD